MKKVILVLAVAFIAVSFKVNSKKTITTSNAKEVKTIVNSDTYKVSIDDSTIIWKGFKPTGEHSGTIAVSKGTVSVIEGNLVGGAFTINMNSIVNTDMPADSEYNGKLVGHLKSADFFDVAKFPTATFDITEVKEVDGTLNVSGNLTIKGITKNITIPAALSLNEGTVVLKSEVFKVDRSEFGVKYGSKSFFDDLKDKFINDEFELSFEVKAAK